MTFPEIDVPLRTDISLDEMVDEEHHVLPCVLTRLSPSLGLVSQFTLYYMHLVCLGVMKSPLTVDEGPSPVSFRGSGKNKQNVFCLCIDTFHRNLPESPGLLRKLKGGRWKVEGGRLLNLGFFCCIQIQLL